ncbi:MAG TPA: arsenate reductase ArsC [Tetrasphaera sp.]|uniref:arsenate-mycothiol transferase ArsC n=1 Tax=Nostocoides sp. TaxID=1917966 RepID=UPI002C3FF5AB|nr:arsenate reductase ArsC [Tetrasphaera sp.]HNQ08111.1 arsenate reductase ArsC [Tetrasphaera sp.]
MHHLDDAAYEQITADLAAKFSDSLTREDVAAAVGRARAELEPTSRHPEFLGILVAKRARDLLQAGAAGHGEALHTVPTILFACEWGTGRSQMAAAFAHRLGGRHVHVRATGRHTAVAVDTLVAEAMSERGIDLEQLFRSSPVGDPVHAPDILVEMGSQPDDLGAKLVVSWTVADPHDQPLRVVREIRDDIDVRVRNLLTELRIPLAG